MKGEMRFIPTGVGNGWTSLSMKPQVTVHPHGCGERGVWPRNVEHLDGSSPRVWGTDPLTSTDPVMDRFIPTGVGNGEMLAGNPSQLPVHPHGCGERVIVFSVNGLTIGSSPRVWGTVSSRKTLPATMRFIPTGVGNGKLIAGNPSQLPVHPHGCGERRPSAWLPCRRLGSSPRVWGTVPRCISRHW